jgi:O-antigen/teichoic acid export membrane protein
MRRASYREGLGFGALSAASVMLVALVTSVAVARLYGIDVVGRFALVSAPALALAYLSTLQEQAALVRAVAVLAPRAPRVTGLFYATLAFSTVLTVVVAAVVLAITWLLFDGPVGHPELFGPAVANTAAFVVLTNTAWNLDTLLSAFRAGRQLFWVRLNQALAYLVVAIALGIVAPTVWGLVAATAASWTVSLAHRLVAIRPFARARIARAELQAGVRALPELVRFGLTIAPRNIAGGLASQFGVWVLGSAGTVAALGAYSRAYLLSSRFLDFQFRISEMLFPTLVERRARGDGEGFDRALVDTMRVSSFALLLPAAAGGGAAAGVMSIFGAGFDAGAPALAVLLLIPALASLSGAQGQALIAAGRPGRASVVSVARAALTLAATVPLVLAFGAVGAAAGLAAGYGLELVWQQRLARATLQRPARELWPAHQGAALAAAYTAGFAVAHALDAALPRPAGVPVSLAAGALAYVTAFAALGGLSARDRRRLAELRAAWTRRRRRVVLGAAVKEGHG